MSQINLTFSLGARGERAAPAYHVDDLLMMGRRQTIKEVFAVLRTDLEIVESEVTCKPSRYLGLALANTAAGCNCGIDHEYVECVPESYNMTALKSSIGMRWRTTKKNCRDFEHRMYRPLVGKLQLIDSGPAMGKACRPLAEQVKQT